ncbi:MAG TPA: hypothetical protein VMU04_15565 [Candidatus Acidoferrum sp.]|nr:hypothetical protein [Candidatus Acidoferrum sp.]
MWRILAMLIVPALAVVLLQAGCATNAVSEHKESLLVNAGFRAVPAVTPKQRSLLRTLPPDTVSTVVSNGKVYFVFPGKSGDLLYVGNQPQYLNYELQAAKQGYGTGEWNAEWGNWDPQ